MSKVCLLSGLLCFSIFSIGLSRTPLSSGFTFQGRMRQNDHLVDSNVDIRVTLWDAESGGNQKGMAVESLSVPVTYGLFSVFLDFGVDVFNDEDRWLAFEVRSPAGIGGYELLSPRRPVTAVPYSLQTKGITVDDTGDVGIGTLPTSGAKIELAKPMGSPCSLRLSSGPYHLDLISDTSPNGARIEYKTDDNFLGNLDIIRGGGDPPNFGNIRFFTGTQDGLERMRITYDGNVELAAAGGTSDLYLTGAGLAIGRSGTQNYPSIGYGFKFTSGSSHVYGANGPLSRLDFDHGGFRFYTAPVGPPPESPVNWTETFTVLDSGRVGIGADNPMAMVHVKTSAQGSISNLLRLGNSGDSSVANTGSAIQFVLGDGGGSQTEAARIEAVSIGGASQLRIGISTAPNLVLLEADKVGIGRTPTTYTFEVEGDAGKTVGGANWATISDERVKTDIQDVVGALATLKRIRPRMFHYTEEFRTMHPSMRDHADYNVVAQEYCEVFPDFVSERSEDGLLMVNTSPLPILSVAAINELSERLEQKERVIGEQSAQISLLKTELENMRRQIDEIAHKQIERNAAESGNRQGSSQ